MKLNVVNEPNFLDFVSLRGIVFLSIFFFLFLNVLEFLNQTEGMGLNNIAIDLALHLRSEAHDLP